MSGEPTEIEVAISAALDRMSEPGRLDAAQRVVTEKAPELQRLLARALEEGGWFDGAHEQAVQSALVETDGNARERAVRTLIAEETRVGMFVGVAVGIELAKLVPQITDETHEGES